MFKTANNFCQRLWKDDSGVVLAVTVIVFLVLFMMGCAVYAIGEVVRQRVELQNACDAAAYTAAIIESDTNSRVAALNRGMAWTYVQMCRMEMDYIVDKWLWLTLKRWGEIDDIVSDFNSAGTCNKGRPLFYWNGFGGMDHIVRLNFHLFKSIEEIKIVRAMAAGEGKSYDQLAVPIDEARLMIEQMNAKEVEAISRIPQRVSTAVKSVLLANISEDYNDTLAGGANIMYKIYQEEDPLANCFRILRLDEEDDFIVHSDYYDGPYLTLGPGTDVWFIRKADGEGIQRRYREPHLQYDKLIAEWDWWSSVWVLTEAGCIFAGEIRSFQHAYVLGDDPEIYDEQYYITALAQPQVVQDTYFARGGSVIVALSRRMNNPLFFIYQAPGQEGVFKPFTVNGGNRWLWTAASSIAGYMSTKEPGPGHYEITLEDNSKFKKWNLKTSDWDAVLLPLHRAKALGIARTWVGDTAGIILAIVRGGGWIPLQGGGGALGAQGAPKGMNEGAELDWETLEGWVLH